jgi:hypothetical protein
MIKSLAKAEALSRSIAENLQKRYAGSSTIDTVRQARDANGWPMIFCSDGGVESASNPVIAIRIMNVDAVSKDVFGNDLNAYAPHTLEVAYELTAANNPIPTDTDILKAEFESILKGVRLLLKELTNGTAVTAANMDAASAAADLEDLYWPNKSV